MKLVQVYECLCDETRLRILNLLTITPMCVCHMQKVLELPQVKVSKHLIYLKDREIVAPTRYDTWMLYALTKESCAELERNLKCLKECSKDYSIFAQDIERLDLVMDDIKEIQQKIQAVRG